MTTATKLELRIDLGPEVVGDYSTYDNKLKSPYLPAKSQKRAQTTGSKPAHPVSSLTMPEDKEDNNNGEDTKPQTEKRRLRRSRASKQANDKAPKPILRNKDTPPSRSKVTIKEEDNEVIENKQQAKRAGPTPSRNTPAVTINTPLRGNPDSPLKPYKLRNGGRTIRSSLMQLATSRATSHSGIAEERKPIDVQAGMKALKQLLNAINVGTRMLEFKDMLQVKVALGMSAHIAQKTLEDLNTFEKVIDELSVLWKINRMDLDLLEYLLREIEMLDRFSSDLENYKSTVEYDNLTASSEREVTTIIGSLHNLLQGSEEANGTYTTMCFLHYGDVYNFTRARLTYMKQELSSLLSIHPTQMIYLVKVAADKKGYVTVFQMPCSIIKKIVFYARKNHEVLMSLGLKGIQITGSDGLRYTQSLGYLQEKIAVATQTSKDDTQLSSRTFQTTASASSLPPLSSRMSNRSYRPPTRAHGVSNGLLSQSPDTKGVSWKENFPVPTQRKNDPSIIPQIHPNEAKFERRLNMLKTTVDSLSKQDDEKLASVLLEQIQTLHKTIASLKKDLKEKSRELISRQGFVQKAEKEIKAMEMRLETRAQQISETNDQLLKRLKRVVNENTKLKEILRQTDAELDIYKQLDKENRFRNSIRAVRITKSIQQGV